MALFYHGGIFLSIASDDFTVCLFGWKTQRFPRGSTLGLKCGRRTAAAPDCAKEPLALWTLFIWVAAEYVLRDMAITAISEPPHPRRAALGYTERPVRLQFMAGQVGLYIDVAYSLQRPDAKRPQALKSRVAAREAV